MSAKRSRRRPGSSVLPSRRAFLRGAAGAAVALPFLESLPERSPWAADDPQPVFAFFICTVGGVVRSQFFPDATGPLTPGGARGRGQGHQSARRTRGQPLVPLGHQLAAGVELADAHVEGLVRGAHGPATGPGRVRRDEGDRRRAVGRRVHRRDGAPRKGADRALRRQRQERLRGAAPVVRRTGAAQSGDRQSLQPVPRADGPRDAGRRRRTAQLLLAEPQERPRPGAGRADVADAAPAPGRGRSAAPAAALRRHSRRRDHDGRDVHDRRASTSRRWRRCRRTSTTRTGPTRW